MLATGLVLLLLGLVPSDPWSAVRDVFVAVGSVVIFWALLAVLFAIPWPKEPAVRPRPPDWTDPPGGRIQAEALRGVGSTWP